MTLEHVTVNSGGQGIAGDVDNRTVAPTPATGTAACDLAAPED